MSTVAAASTGLGAWRPASAAAPEEMSAART
jgi:hypothetical protein